MSPADLAIKREDPLAHARFIDVNSPFISSSLLSLLRLAKHFPTLALASAGGLSNIGATG